ncbi:helix-turn-helix transcriptional regulator [Vibrio parahaemolyticus]|uniref:helix-turn-helix transcriptional regulator n=1 Tax=Vibrio parahaemolyticus TaxID=670 RepID=UPI00358F0199
MERRIKHAKKLLSTTSMRVIDIAIECGFSSHAHFTDRFRRYINCSPKQFRNRSLQINSYNTRE